MTKSLGLVFALMLSTSIASAQTSIPIKGTVSLEAAFDEQTNAIGRVFFYYSYVGDGPNPIGSCNSGQICDGSSLLSTLIIPFNSGSYEQSGGCLRHVCAPTEGGYGMTGNLNLTHKFSFLTPSKDVAHFSISVPITISGTVSAQGFNGTLWTVNISGSGTANLSGNITNGLLKFTADTVTYKGMATPQ